MYKVSVIKTETKLYHNYMILKLCRHKYKRSITSKAKKNFLFPQSFSYQFNEYKVKQKTNLAPCYILIIFITLLMVTESL